MSSPISPSIQPIKCFTCHQEMHKPFGKIVHKYNVHMICNPACFDAALKVLGVRDSNNLFTQPVSVRLGSPYPYNLSPVDLRRSPKMENLHKLFLSDDDIESDPEGYRQLRTLVDHKKKEKEDAL